MVSWNMKAAKKEIKVAKTEIKAANKDMSSVVSIKTL